MKFRCTFPIILVYAIALQSTSAQETKPPAQSSEPSTAAAIKQFNDDRVADLSKQIAGKENQPSEAVFKNIKILTGIPAGNL